MKARSSELLLAVFGYADAQIAELKGMYGEDLSQYRQTIVVGDPVRMANVTTMFDFTRRLNTAGYGTLIEKVRSLVGTQLTDLDPFRDGSRIAVTMTARPSEDYKIVVIGDQAFLPPRWVGAETIAGLTHQGTKSIVRTSAGNFIAPHIAETLIREVDYAIGPGVVLGPTMSKYPGLLATAVLEHVNNTVSNIAALMVRGQDETPAKAQTQALPGAKYPAFQELIYRADLTNVSLASFRTTSLFN